MASPNWDWAAFSQPSNVPNSSQKENQTTAKQASIYYNEKLQNKLSSTEQKTGDYEKYSGLKIHKRLISTEELDENMTGRQILTFPQMAASSPSAMLQKNTQEWVTIGVLTHKSKTLPTSKGGSYMLWTLSDLNNTVISLFLFEDAYKKHWKETQGSIIVVINPGIIPASEKDSFALKVHSDNEIAKLGNAIDFGICKGSSQSGLRCKIAVNLSKCEFCVHHVASRFKKMGSKRQALHGSDNFQKNLFKGGDVLVNMSAGTYGQKNTKKRSRPKDSLGIGFGTRILTNGQPFPLQKLPKVTSLQHKSLESLNTTSTTTTTKKATRSEKMAARLLGIEKSKVVPKLNMMNMMSEIQKGKKYPTSRHLHSNSKISSTNNNICISNLTRNPTSRPGNDLRYLDLNKVTMNSKSAPVTMKKAEPNKSSMILQQKFNAAFNSQSILDKQKSSINGSNYSFQPDKIAVEAYRCETCLYTLETPRKNCGEYGHFINKVMAFKRRFCCKKCKNQCTLLNATIPTAACCKCNFTDWIQLTSQKTPNKNMS